MFWETNKNKKKKKEMGSPCPTTFMVVNPGNRQLVIDQEGEIDRSNIGYNPRDQNFKKFYEFEYSKVSIPL